jgi:MoaA/NifB/PqqE/SkfB family radical SAM enzyme
VKIALASFIRRVSLVARKHVLADIWQGDLLKPWHFVRAALKHKYLGYPYSVLIETGNYCNIRCPTCTTPGHKITREKTLMTFENFKRIIGNVKDCVHIAQLYYSGEPLLHPDIARMAEFAGKNHLYTSISTNAVLLTEEKARELFASGLDEIILCLDGASKESYEPFRRGAHFEVVYENIRHFCRQKHRLKLRKPFIVLQCILHKSNQAEIEKMQQLAEELKVDRLLIKTFALGEYAYSKEEIKQLSERFFPDDPRLLQRVRYQKEGDTLAIRNPPSTCQLANSLAVVLVDGRLSMCCYDLQGDYVWGNLLNQSLKGLWFSEEVERQKRLARDRQYPLCKVCSIY